jgi:hypothetical protein
MNSVEHLSQPGRVMQSTLSGGLRALWLLRRAFVVTWLNRHASKLRVGFCPKSLLSQRVDVGNWWGGACLESETRNETEIVEECGLSS